MKEKCVFLIQKTPSALVNRLFMNSRAIFRYIPFSEDKQGCQTSPTKGVIWETEAVCLEPIALNQESTSGLHLYAVVDLGECADLLRNRNTCCARHRVRQ